MLMTPRRAWLQILELLPLILDLGYKVIDTKLVQANTLATCIVLFTLTTDTWEKRFLELTSSSSLRCRTFSILILSTILSTTALTTSSCLPSKLDDACLSKR